MMAKKLNQRKAYQSLYLARFDFVLHYCLDKSIDKPNVLFYRLNHGNGSYNNRNMVLMKPELLAAQVIEEMTFESEEQSLLMDIYYKNQLFYQEKPMARAARKLQQSSAKSIHSFEWSEVNRLLLFHGKIYLSDLCNLYHHIVSLYHDTKVAGYAKCQKTLELVSQSYQWPHISRYIS